jgi:signal peptidase I
MTQLLRLTPRLVQTRPFRLLLAVAFGAAVGIAAGYNFKTTVSIVDGTSMSPTYNPGAYVFTSSITSQLQRGDVVLVNDTKSEYALKRIIGLPGEAIDLWRGYVFVNRRMLLEPYLPKYTLTFPDQRVLASHFQLGANQYLVLGDNRLYSMDSRTYGPVTRKQIVGRVPEPSNTPRPEYAPYTLPGPGKMLIQSL